VQTSQKYKIAPTPARVPQVCEEESNEIANEIFEVFVCLYMSPVYAYTANRRWSRYSAPSDPEPAYVFVEGEETNEPAVVKEDRWYPNLGLR
jgi:hypothetical protein